MTNSVTAFMYHDVRDYTGDRYKKRYDLKYCLSVTQFEKQIKYITSNYKVISGQQFYDLDGNIDDNYAILTFDDGLLDHYTNVLPVLNRYGVSGTFLIPAAPVVENYIIHSHKIQFLLACVESEKLLVGQIFELLNVNDRERAIIWENFSVSAVEGNWWSEEMVFITNFLRLRTKKMRDITEELFTKYVAFDQKKFNEEFYMNESHVAELVKNGMEIGGHGYSSENLLLLQPEDREDDIAKSIDFVSVYSKDGFVSFSYPNGGHNLEISEVLESKGCDMAYTTEGKSINNRDVIFYSQIPRVVGVNHG